MLARSTPVHNHNPITMVRLSKPAALQHIGDFCWRIEEGRRTLVLAIPYMGAGTRGFIMSTWTCGFTDEFGPKWHWDGNVEQPTLSPSLHAVGIWHGYVRNGILIEAGYHKPKQVGAVIHAGD